MRRDDSQQNSVTSNQGSRNDGSIARRSRDGAVRRKSRICFDIFDRDRLARSKGPRTGCPVLDGRVAKKIREIRFEAELGGYMEPPIVVEDLNIAHVRVEQINRG